MRRILLALLALIAALSPQVVLADPADIAAASRGVVRVVLIGDEDGEPRLIGHGSGFAVGPDLVLTNAHVVSESREIDGIRIGIVPPQGKSGWFASVVAFSPGNDLALLRLTEKGSLPPLTMFTGPIDDGEDVYAVGYPGNVDLAQGLNVGDIVSPISPVKSHGQVSSGRTAKQFDTILHTASIGSGNSGGPLLDACGRVIGANSFGTEMASRADSPFYFAVSMREIMKFLTDAGVMAQSTGSACQSLADSERAEAERAAAANEESARSAAARRATAIDNARRQAQSDVISERENAMAIAGLSILLALIAGAATLYFRQQERVRDAKFSGAAGGLLVLAAILVWVTRTPISQIETRANEIVEAQASATPAPSASASAARETGDYICVLDQSRSRVTVSPLTDVPFHWTAEGCVNKRTQYGLAATGWSRVLVPREDETVTVASFDPNSATYKTERYLVDLDTMEKMRTERGKFTAPVCGAGEAAARKLGEAEGALKALLPTAPNERMVYHCNRSSE